MKRRDFIKAGITAMVAAQLNPFESIRSIAHADPIAADIARVKGRDIVNMVQRGLDAIGGIGNFVKPGQTVAIKPNFSWGRNPEEAYNTNPYVVGALVGICKQAGAKEVNVIDNPINSPAICLHKSGIQREVEAAGGNAFSITSFRTAAIDGGYRLKQVDFSTHALDADVLISVPIAKQWGIVHATVGVKGWMGLIKDRSSFHANRNGDLHEMIAGLMLIRKPDLTIIDGIRVLRGGAEEKNTLLIGTDPLALDAMAMSELLRIDPTDVKHLTLAHSLRKIGSMNYQAKTIVDVVV